MKGIVAIVVVSPAAIAAAPAGADSLAFIRDNNVWLANPDGSGQYQVTFDGTASAPYETPSQSDGGVLVAVRAAPGQRRQLYRMTQSGALLNAPDQHAGAGDRSDRREGLARRLAGGLLVRHDGERPDLSVLRQRRARGTR
jgi:hypothetical protein